MKLIVACDPKGGIGYKNKLPWDKLQGDLPRFKELTTGKVVVMGRNTWDSLPVKPLPNRTNFVVTSDSFSIPVQINHEKIFSITDLKTLRHFNEHACIIGGAQLIKSSWKFITSVNLTITKNIYDCDKFIDLDEIKSNFVLQHSEEFADHHYQIWTKNVNR